MSNFTPFTALGGGLLIGLSAALLLYLNGRIAGISGILNGALARTRGDTAWRVAFIVGMLAGGAVMTATGGPRPRIYGVLGCGLLLSVCFVLVGLKPSLFLVGAGVILWYVGLPIMNGSSSAIWQSKVPAHVQGRVFAMRRMLAQFTTPIGDFSAGPLADKIFIPLLLPGGALAGGVVGEVVGVGPGRGIGLMFLALAAVPGLAALWGFLNPRIRNLETEIPDAPVQKAEPAPAEDAGSEPATA
ncbi:MAG TPA: hypothetical protein DD490_17505 [Acidobacteria bacterium]|nr:hypothetical protein [Acidobacteriota bacterium]